MNCGFNTRHCKFKMDRQAESQSQIQRRQEGQSINKYYSLFPIKDEISYYFFKIQETVIWTANELDFTQDKIDYDNLPPSHQRVIDIIMAFFLPGDGLINDNLTYRFLCECKTREAKMFYMAQMYIENIHAETYGLIAYSLYDEDRMNELHNMADNSEYMKRKFAYMEKWTNSARPLPERLLAFACTEGIFFCNLFLYIFWFKASGKLRNVTHSNEVIRVDELIHRDYGCVQHIQEGGCSDEIAFDIVSEAVDIEVQFGLDVIKDLPPDEFKPEDITEFTRLMGDQVLSTAGHPLKYNAINPYPWMDNSNLVQKNNFFEVKAGNYTRSSISKALNWKARSGRGDVTEEDNNDEVEF